MFLGNIVLLDGFPRLSSLTCIKNCATIAFKSILQCLVGHFNFESLNFAQHMDLN